MKYSEFNLDARLKQGLAATGYVECLPVQELVLEKGLDGSDLYVQSQTGTGKTAAYLVSLLQQLLSAGSKRALIMVPTRELVVQVEEEARRLARDTDIQVAGFYGGVGYETQVAALKDGAQILVGTPGRVLDLEDSHKMNLADVSFLVIDEADRMFDMGFYPDLRKLLKALPPKTNRQTMLFSATLSSYVKNLAWEYTENAKEITIEPENVTVNEIEQKLFHIGSNEKMSFLLGVLKNEAPDTTIVFCNTKKTTEIVSKRLKMNGIRADFLIGDLAQKKRLAILNAFKKAGKGCLVATDVAARGVDVSGLDMVINYDLPQEAENYVHRIGRTARAGKTGKAYSFCTEQDVYNLPDIQKYLEQEIPVAVAPAEYFYDDASAKTFIRLDNDRGGSRGGKDRRANFEDRKGVCGSTKYGATKSERNNRSETKPWKKAPAKKQRSKGKTVGEKTRAAKNQRSSDDLARLSFEERMTYYKSQYTPKDEKPQHKHKTAKNPQKKAQPKKANSVDSKEETPRKEKRGINGLLARLFGKS